MRGVLPDSILERPKMGFPVPFAQWMKGPWNQVAREVLLDRRSRERGIIEPGTSSACSTDMPRVSRGGRRHLEPAEPRALVSHVRRRQRNPDAAARGRRCADRGLAATGDRMKILWLNANLLLPLDKGGKLRTWH